MIIAASLALAAWTAGARPQASFFLLPFRAWELALGAVVAVAAAPARHRGAAATAGLLLVATAIAFAPRLPGILPIALAAGGTALVLRYAVPGTAAARLLSQPPRSASG